MGKAIEPQIKKMIDDIDHHLEQIDERLDQIRHILDSVQEASEVSSGKKPQAAKEPEKREKKEKHERQEKQQDEEVMESASKEKDVYGSCPLCGNPLLVLGRAPLVVECSNVKCRNTFTPK